MELRVKLIDPLNRRRHRLSLLRTGTPPIDKGPVGTHKFGKPGALGPNRPCLNYGQLLFLCLLCGFLQNWHLPPQPPTTKVRTTPLPTALALPFAAALAASLLFSFAALAVSLALFATFLTLWSISTLDLWLDAASEPSRRRELDLRILELGGHGVLPPIMCRVLHLLHIFTGQIHAALEPCRLEHFEQRDINNSP